MSSVWGGMDTCLNSWLFIFIIKRLGGERTDGDWLLQNWDKPCECAWVLYKLHHKWMDVGFPGDSSRAAITVTTCYYAEVPFPTPIKV